MAGLVAQLAIGLAAGGIASIIKVVDCAKALWAVFIVLIV